jgi:hypothetical protein
MYGQLKPHMKASSVGDDEMGCLVTVEWQRDDMAERLMQDVVEQVEAIDLVQLLVASVMQYSLERRSREIDEDRQRRGREGA